MIIAENYENSLVLKGKRGAVVVKCCQFKSVGIVVIASSILHYGVDT